MEKENSNVVLNPYEQKIRQAIKGRTLISRNIHHDLQEKRTFGEKLSDGIANFGGSWTFICICGMLLILWIATNTLFLSKGFDPFPFILLNLILSMLAVLQAPIILMSQNRQATHDRLDAAHDYEVNLKAELEIRDLHEKLDELREQQWAELVKLQQQQIEMLERLLRSGVSQKSLT